MGEYPQYDGETDATLAAEVAAEKQETATDESGSDEQAADLAEDAGDLTATQPFESTGE